MGPKRYLPLVGWEQAAVGLIHPQHSCPSSLSGRQLIRASTHPCMHVTIDGAFIMGRAPGRMPATG